MKQAGKRDLAGFESVAGNEEDNVNVNENEDNSVNEENDNIVDGDKDLSFDVDDNVSEDDILNDLLTTKPNKKNAMEMRGIYFEQDVLKVMDKLAKANKKGFKSALVNAAVKKVLKEKGLM